MAYFQIMALAVFMTAFFLWKMNVLLAMVSSAMWFAMLAYHLANRPSNVAQGSPADTFIILALIGAALVMPIIALMYAKYSKEKGGKSWFAGTDRNNHENGHAESSGRTSYSSTEKPRGLMDLSPDEYKAYLRSRVRNRRR
ncbi:hypothetical protein LCGC14_1326430 [marine sediment metagenome]|uniref:Uncharacterized protein n=1 Tax=marine sediment metagenome TaxID=412755 RepID=A0A0F9KIL0_9ZZZZ